jgi:hypothetical protein
VGGPQAEETSRAAGFDHIVKPADPQEILADLAAFVARGEPAALAVA